MAITKIQVLEALKNVSYPNFEMNIVEAKMVEHLKIERRLIAFDLILPSFDDTHRDRMVRQCIEVLQGEFGTDIQLKIKPTSKLNFTLPEEEKLLPGVKNIIAVASGKGGVGKSTIAVNLAVALAKLGHKAGLLDADIYGPSVPKMFGVEDARPIMEQINGKDHIAPITKHGVKILSIGFFVDASNATIWRGPMASGAFKQLLTEAAWGDLDYLIIDLPPGTSDIHLTLVQTVAVTGAVIVSTPQEVALADAIKGISMFRSESINVPVIGIVENMAWFTPAELPDNKYYIFGKEGCTKLSKQFNVPVLAQIPIVQSIREGGDEGEPSAIKNDTISAQAFSKFAENFILAVQKRKEDLPETSKVKVK